MAYQGYEHPRADLEVKVTITSAKDLKNVNWRHGSLKPYAVVWVDPNSKSTTNVDDNGDNSPTWDETLVLSLASYIHESVLSIDIVHANAAEDTKPLIGSARVPLKEIVDEVGIGQSAYRTLKLRRPSGRPQGKLELKVVVRDHYRAPVPEPYCTPSYPVPPPAGSRDYAAPYAAPPSQYPSAYGQPPSYGQPAAYGQSPSYGQPAVYGQTAAYEQPVNVEKKHKFGMGTGLAVGAVAGVLGALALGEVEDSIADRVAERVEDDLWD
ncbi:hypothetical protein NE237_019247 [Protea cynaroides]|uniref:C2 domain-containing protein n=1 Tax=Protea cynaroides TaxID=273540 RepID=A0A9Q0KBC8_9MAGN|nr:hypothetical protein NE237_019247 [Protea cynaroides]